jgi:exopolysaccharide biosynthesis polyprenyl glycosylphosphotransferase
VDHLNQREKQGRRLSLRVGEGVTVAAIYWLCLRLFEANAVYSVLVSIAAALATSWSLHRRRRNSSAVVTDSEDVFRVAGAAVVGAGVAALVSLQVLNGPGAGPSRGTVSGLAVVLAAGCVWCVVMVGRAVARRLAAELPRARVVVVGCGQAAHDMLRVVTDHADAELNIVGFVGPHAEAVEFGLGGAWLGKVGDLESVIVVHRIDRALVASPSSENIAGARAMHVLRSHNIATTVSVSPTSVDSAGVHASSIGRQPTIEITWPTEQNSGARLKRFIDLVGASTLLVLGLPLMACVALVIRISDRGPIFYRSERVGRGQIPFDMIKFRSMKVDAPALKAELLEQNERTGPLFKLTNDPRTTRVGRLLRATSIDELPQVLNVLRGEMSLVGPRPALAEEVAFFDDELLARFAVNPGITGLWQVDARHHCEFGAYRRLDLHYVANCSMRLDVEILVATVTQTVAGLIAAPLKRIRRAGGDVVDLRWASSAARSDVATDLPAAQATP